MNWFILASLSMIILELIFSLGLIRNFEYFSKSEVNPNIRFASTTELLDYFNITPLKNNLILLKGSRGIALEKVLPAL